MFQPFELLHPLHVLKASNNKDVFIIQVTLLALVTLTVLPYQNSTIDQTVCAANLSSGQEEKKAMTCHMKLFDV